MRFLFRKRKGQFADSRLTNAAGKQYNRVRSGWASWMQKRTAQYSPTRWTLLLVIFVLSTCSYSVYLAASSILYKPQFTLTVSPIRKLEHLTQTGDPKPKDALLISKEEYQRIREFKLYMDSLAKSLSGRVQYDSILKGHPGLMDSVRLIEKMYNSKNK